MNSKTILPKTKTWQTQDLTFLFNTGTEEPEIDLVIINGEMAYRQMTAKDPEEVDSQDIQTEEKKDKNLFKTIHGDSNWNS